MRRNELYLPDATTVAFFRERLRKANVIYELFETFESYLRDQGSEPRGGQIIDATPVPDPKQRNSLEFNKEIKANRLPDGWNESPMRLQQKDLDARWVKKMISIINANEVLTIAEQRDLEKRHSRIKRK